MTPEEVVRWLKKKLPFWERERDRKIGASLGYRCGQIDLAKKIILLLEHYERKEE